MSDKIEKAEGQTPEYQYLKKVADELSSDWSAVKGHSPETVEAVRESCARAWNDAVRYCISPRGLKCKPGTVAAARRRIREAKHMLGFLDPR